MAIEFVKVSIHNRAKGHSAVAGAAYRSGDKLIDYRTGETHDYTHRDDVAYAHLALPEAADQEYFSDREIFWNAVEKAEKRKDSQLAKDVVLALPRELNLSEMIELSTLYAHDHFVSKGLAVDIAIHDVDTTNPHAHLYVTTRRVIGRQMDVKKARDLNPSFSNWQGGRGFINEETVLQANWRRIQNDFFDRKGMDIRVDPKHLIPQRHEGRNQSRQGHYLREENKLRRQASIDIALNDSTALLNQMSKQFDDFRLRDLEALINKNTDNDLQRAQALENVMADPDLIELGPADDGRIRYTTKQNMNRDLQIEADAYALDKVKHVKPTLRQINKTIADYGLHDHQADALYHILRSNRIAAVVGRAGSGKSYMLKAANAVWRDQNLHVFGMALAGVAAEGLEQSSGITSHTIAHYKTLIHNNAWHLNASDVVVLDEAGMVDSPDMAMVLRHVRDAKAKLVLIGDHDQLQPVGAGAVFRAIVERIGFAEMNVIVRQRDEGDRQASTLLSKGHVNEALQHYEQKGGIHLIDSKQANDHTLVFETLIDHWSNSITPASLKDNRILAFKRDDVERLNFLAHERLIAINGLKGRSAYIETENGKRDIYLGERIIFNRPKKKMGICNGHIGTVIDMKGGYLTVKIDTLDNPIQFKPKDYHHFDYGYATTTHKSQGATLDRVYVFASSGWNRFLSYVGLTRHRDHVSVYANKAAFPTLDLLAKQMGRDSIKDNVLDYPVAYALRRGFDIDSVAGRFVTKTSTVANKIKNAWDYVVHTERYLQAKDFRKQQDEKTKIRQDAVKVAEYVDLMRSTGKEWREITEAITKKLITRDELFEQSNYKVLVDDTHYKNALAAQLIAEPERYEKAFELNYVNMDRLEKDARSYHLKSHVDRYIQAYRADQHSEMLRQATLIAPHMRDHYRDLAFSAFIHDIDLKVLTKHINESWKQRITLDMPDIRMISQYDDYRRQSSLYLNKLKALNKHITEREQSNQNSTKLNERKQRVEAILSEVVARRDSIANQIHGNEPLIEQAKRLNEFFDPSKLKQHAKEHRRREIVKRYLSLDTSLTEQDRLAFIIYKQKDHFKRIARGQNIFWPTLFEKANRQERVIIYSKLTPAERSSFNVVREYEEAYKHSIQHYLALKRFEETLVHPPTLSQIKVRDELKKTLFIGYAKRHEAAYNVVKSHMKILDKFPKNFDKVKLMRYAKLHEERLAAKERVEQYLLSPSDELAFEIAEKWRKHAYFLKQNKVNGQNLHLRARRHRYSLIAETLNDKEKALYLAISKYDIARIGSGQAWSQSRQHNNQNDEYLRIAKSKSDERNQFAYEVLPLLTNDISSSFIENHFKFSKQSLHEHAGAHELRSFALQFSEATMLERTALSAQSQTKFDDRSIWIAFKQQNLDPKPYFDLMSAKKQSAYRNVLSGDEKGYYDYVVKYGELSKQCAENWKKINTLGKQVNPVERQAAWSITNQRNEYANHIAKYYSLYEKHCHFEGIQFSRIEKQSQSYHQYLERQAAIQNRDQIKTTDQPKIKTVTRYNREAIETALLADVEQTYLTIFGEPKKRENRTLRYHQGLIVTLKGKAEGSWHSFTENVGGGPIQAIQHVYNLDYKDALKEGARITGLSDSQAMTTDIKQQALYKERQAQKQQRDKLDHERRILSARSIWDGRSSLPGTLAERYLKEERGIARPELLEAMYWPVGKTWIDYKDDGSKITRTNKLPAVLFPAYNQKGELEAIQRIYLEKNAPKKNSFMENAKLSKGVMRNNAALIKKGEKGGTLFISEGPETGGSIAMVSDKKDWVYSATSASNIQNLLGFAKSQVKEHDIKKVIIAADFDGFDHVTQSLYQTISKEYHNELNNLGLGVDLKFPIPVKELNKTDYNDVLQSLGEKALAEQLGITQFNVSQTKQPDELKRFLDSDETVQKFKRIAALKKAIENDKPELQAINRVKDYMNQMAHTTDKNAKMNLRQDMNKHIERISKDDRLMTAIERENPSIGKFIKTRAKSIAANKGKDRGIDPEH